MIKIENVDVHNIARAIYSARNAMNSWDKSDSDLEYKAQWNGRIYRKIDTFFPSSQICSCCGYKNPETKDLSVREWVCPICQTIHDRDVNAAKNILSEGLRLLA